jgi:uncharacterized membrane-anchored protein YhcB (DUF1043 family)
MNFWFGLIIGVIIGANIGVVVAGLLASSKRQENSIDKMEMQPTHESAVMDGDSEYAGRHRDRARISKSNDAGPQGTP